jgi:hypothetical protein
VLVQSTKRVRILVGASVLSMGRVRERFDASDNRIAKRIADTKSPNAYHVSPGEAGTRFPVVRQRDCPEGCAHSRQWWRMMKSQKETIEAVAGVARSAGASCSFKQLSGGISHGCDRLRWPDSLCDPVLDLSQRVLSDAAALCWRGKSTGTEISTSLCGPPGCTRARAIPCADNPRRAWRKYK